MCRIYICMYVCIHTQYICIYIYICIYVYVYIYIQFVHINIFIYSYSCVFLFLYTCVWMKGSCECFANRSKQNGFELRWICHYNCFPTCFSEPLLSNLLRAGVHNICSSLWIVSRWLALKIYRGEDPRKRIEERVGEWKDWFTDCLIGFAACNPNPFDPCAFYRLYMNTFETNFLCIHT